jgi:hypothetical protein
MNLIASFFSGVLNFLFGCGHDNVTRPFTLQHRTYKVCLDCGHELPYSAQTMRYVSPRTEAVPIIVPARTASILAFEAPRTMHRERTLHDSKVAA